ncbi:cytidylyltransferase domain-containing protein [Bacillus niameyensis]|uniref:cytidylyltransferase domain-containing protein n=1 Tax=Bacillus niameyensis TaxID=1522308 RepID=UPI000782A2D5|nr:NTP transferase domain-containing protein [Bacillus niameyensis]
MRKKPKIAVVVSCRLKSTRLPLKALLPINGISLIERCLMNCLAIPEADAVVLATSYLPQDNPLEAITLDGKVTVVRGDPENLVDRTIEAAKAVNADIVFRVTGDNPAVSPEISSFLIQEHLKNDADYTQAKASSVGTAGNVINVKALERLTNLVKPLTHTEYLPFYFLNNPSYFSVLNLDLPSELLYPEWRLTIDEIKDLEMFQKLYENLHIGHRPLFYKEMRDYLVQHPEVWEINKDVQLKWRDDLELVEEVNRATTLE